MKGRNLKYKDKIVLAFNEESQNRIVGCNDSAYQFVKQSIENIIISKSVATDKIFIGGSKRDLYMYISGLIELYNLYNIKLEDKSYVYKDDKDFII